jgi:peptidoglycan-N-acetylglucosamine deacetylase
VIPGRTPSAGRGLKQRARAPLARMNARATRAKWRGIDTAARVNRRVSGGAVALTFDDGPHPGSTDLILDVLAELDVRATFFCVGRNARANPGLVRRMQSEGHEVGSHSMTHPHPGATGLSVLAAEYADGRRAVAGALGRDTALFRPPHGHLKPASAVVVRRAGLLPWLWTVDPEDWRPGVTSEHIDSVAGRAMSGDVVLLHDWVEQPWAPEALDRTATIAALPGIVQQIRRRGLQLTSLPPSPH